MTAHLRPVVRPGAFETPAPVRSIRPGEETDEQAVETRPAFSAPRRPRRGLRHRLARGLRAVFRAPRIRHCRDELLADEGGAVTAEYAIVIMATMTLKGHIFSVGLSLS